MGKRRVRHGVADPLRRQLRPLRLLGIYRKIEIGRSSKPGEFEHAWHELAQHAAAAQGLVAWMQGRELDGDTWPVGQRLLAGGPTDFLHRTGVSIKIASRIGRSAGTLPEHIEGIAVEPARSRMRTHKRFFDRLPEHEMISEHTHRLARRSSQGRLAEPLYGGREDAFRRLARLGDPRAYTERPG